MTDFFRVAIVQMVAGIPRKDRARGVREVSKRFARIAKRFRDEKKTPLHDIALDEIAKVGPESMRAMQIISNGMDALLKGRSRAGLAKMFEDFGAEMIRAQRYLAGK